MKRIIFKILSYFPFTALIFCFFSPLKELRAENIVPAPLKTTKLIFLHHSTGEAWLADWGGRLGLALSDNNYFVSDSNYDWGPDNIGDTTDIGHWWAWFRGPKHDKYTKAVYAESKQHSGFSRKLKNPGGENEIVMFKSCFPNSKVFGSPSDTPNLKNNPLQNEGSWSKEMSVSNIKGIYVDLLEYFKTRQDKMFVIVTAPPLAKNETNRSEGENARAINNWLVKEYLKDYPFLNVVVFDYFNVLTSKENQNSHTIVNGKVQHIQKSTNNYSSFPEKKDDSHPTAKGHQKATKDFVPYLNYHYKKFKESRQK